MLVLHPLPHQSIPGISSCSCGPAGTSSGVTSCPRTHPWRHNSGSGSGSGSGRWVRQFRGWSVCCSGPCDGDSGRQLLGTSDVTAAGSWQAHSSGGHVCSAVHAQVTLVLCMHALLFACPTLQLGRQHAWLTTRIVCITEHQICVQN
jgi:hypothetical protein